MARLQFEFLNFKRTPRAQETVGKKKRLATNHNHTKKEGNGGDIFPCESAALPFDRFEQQVALLTVRFCAFAVVFLNFQCRFGSIGKP
ncbi:hypothetical protein Zmor_015386 [Zophobas morio]|uniref:Uncharacterized protein n=1 Tax=Zophobas morio TaxID=2755281 RepID=A0AA38MGH8_9CUCU|nr:hypothetical protein Zmor_015386 [Zophobas morio]